MAVIFTASADSHSYQHSSRLFEPFIRWLFPHLAEARVQELHHLFRKCGHLSEYSVFALLVWRAIRRPQRNSPRPWRWDEAGLTLAIVFAYAASDELHQVFVPTRTALASDVLIDSSGGAAALLILWIFGRCRKKW